MSRGLVGETEEISSGDYILLHRISAHAHSPPDIRRAFMERREDGWEVITGPC